MKQFSRICNHEGMSSKLRALGTKTIVVMLRKTNSTRKANLFKKGKKLYRTPLRKSNSLKIK